MLSQTNCTLTHFVKHFSVGSQLQRVQSLRLPTGNYLLKMVFFPKPKYLLFFFTDQGGALATEKKDTGNAAPHSTPIELYLRAHFLNHRISEVLETNDGGLALAFGSEKDRKLEIRESSRGLDFRCWIPGKLKPFQASLALGPLASTEAPVPRTGDTPAPSQAERKYQRLLKNVEQDFQKAQQERERLESIARLVQHNPESLVDASLWTEEQKEAISTLFRSSSLKPWQRSHLKKGLDCFFRVIQRLERKVTLARKRKKELEEGGFVAWEAAQVRRRAVGAGPGALSGSTKLGVKKKNGGKWVSLDDHVWARVGRTAKDNDELFRQAASNDLWFHVRGAEGAHVWIPRGQFGLPARAPIEERYLDWGAQLAVLNSKVRASRSGYVDVALRRDLKKIKGAAGAVRILRSQVRFTQIDPAFEGRVFAKEVSSKS